MYRNKLHIVSMDIPWPADYGGVIDVFYKVKSLHEAGAEIYLHCYEYGRPHASELNKYCKEVYYYKRPSRLKNISLSKPYIVYSRRNDELLKRLTEMEAPILFEGIHTTIFIDEPALKNRLKGIRTHNIEHEYYAQMAESGSAKLLRMYYKRETGLLKKYETSLHSANVFLPISLTDCDYFRELYPGVKTQFTPPFHPYDTVESLTGSGDYCLYHGNLSHPENLDAAFFLLNEVIPNTNARFIIAGMKPTEELIAACNKVGCTIVPNPDKTIMDDLLANAHIHVLPTFQRSGMKLKLLSALYGGRHVLVNEPMLHGTGLHAACSIANDTQGFIHNIEELMKQPFTTADKQARQAHLQPYDKATNARAVLEALNMR